MDVLVVGLGSMGKRRIRLLQRFSVVEDIIGIDGRLDRRQEAKELYNCFVYDNMDDALSNHKNIKCAFICTSPLSHHTLIKNALTSNLHVFTEINLVSDGYKANIQLAKEKGKVLFLSSTFLYREEIKFIKNKIQTNQKLNYIYHIGQYLPDWHPWENFNDFFVGDKRTNGCREIMAIELPWLVDTFGDILEINTVADNITTLELPYRDNYMIQIKHANGNKGLLAIDVVSPKAVRNLEVYGEKIYCSWNGAPDTVQYYDVPTKSVKKAILGEAFEHMDGYDSFIVENAYQDEIKDFFDVIYNGKQQRYGFEQDIKILKLIDEIEGIYE